MRRTSFASRSAMFGHADTHLIDRRQGNPMQTEQPKGAGAAREPRAVAGRRCDLCGNEVVAVRRVALDREYDRLQLAHKELYACEPCFEAKEQRRLGLHRR
jgi:hypothetical protein